jgi:TonB family protein
MSRNSFFAGAMSVVAAITLFSGLARAADAPPKVDTSRPTPVVYPATSQRAGEEGTVVISVYVTDAGKPQRINIAKSSGYTALDTAAMETAMNWHYLPAMRGGSTTSDWGNFQIVYKLPEQPAAASK